MIGHRPNHTSSWKPGKPASDAVGISGANGERVGPVTAKPRILPQGRARFALRSLVAHSASFQGLGVTRDTHAAGITAGRPSAA